jgi:hypothetical protein
MGTGTGTDSGGLFGEGGGMFSAGVPTSIPGESGWTSSTTMMLLAVIVLCMVAIAPPLIARHLRAGSAGAVVMAAPMTTPPPSSSTPNPHDTAEIPVVGDGKAEQ